MVLGTCFGWGCLCRCGEVLQLEEIFVTAEDLLVKFFLGGFLGEREER